MSSWYAVRVRGRLSPDILSAREPLAPVDAGTETLLVGVLPDQAALHGLITRLESFGAELVALERLPPTWQPQARQ
jgi:hypothetical protein